METLVNYRKMEIFFEVFVASNSGITDLQLLFNKCLKLLFKQKVKLPTKWESDKAPTFGYAKVNDYVSFETKLGSIGCYIPHSNYYKHIDNVQGVAEMLVEALIRKKK